MKNRRVMVIVLESGGKMSEMFEEYEGATVLVIKMLVGMFIQYMAMGKPVIITKLHGIMKEFGKDSGIIYV